MKTITLACFTISLIFNSVFAEPLFFANTKGTPEGLVCGAYSETATRKKINLQGNWEVSYNGGTSFSTIQIPASIDYEGESIFRRAFRVDSNLLRSSSLKLIAYGINNECEILINNIVVGKHECGFTVFEIAIPDGVLRGDVTNELQIIVNNKLNPQQTLPPRKQRFGWKNFNGIIRDIFLLAYPRVSLDSVVVRTKVSSQNLQGSIQILATLKDTRFFSNEKNLNYSLSAEVVEASTDYLIASSTQIIPVNDNGKCEGRIQITVSVPNPRLWSTENPTLYRLRVNLTRNEGKVTTLVDQYIRDIGFTSIVPENNVLKVNGVPFTIKGVVWYEDAPDYGASLSYERMEKDIALIKALGANTIRCAFHPPHPYIIDLCSRYGLFVTVEVPVWEVTSNDLKSEGILSKVQTSIDAVLYTASASPSVLAWGIGSSFDTADPRTREYIRSMRDRIALQDDRPVYYGTSLLRNDVCANEVPCVGIVPLANDSKEFKELVHAWKKRYPYKVTFVLGYGKEVLHGNRSGYSHPLSEQAQARFFIQHYTSIKEAGISGGFIDAFSDWRGDVPLLTMKTMHPTVYPRGLLGYHREKRLAYDVVRALYSNARIDPFPAGKYQSAYPLVYIGLGFALIFLWGYLFTYNHHFSEAVRRSLLRSYNFFEDIRERRGVHFFYTALMLVFNATALALFVSSVFYYFRSNSFFDYVITIMFPEPMLKRVVMYIAWNDLGGIMVLLGCILCGFVALLIMWKIIATLLGKQFFLNFTLASIAWGSAPVVFLVPIAMVLFKVLQNPLYAIPSGIITTIVLLWSLLRVLYALSITYEESYPKVIGIGILLLCGVLGGIYVYYEQTMGITSYLFYLYHLYQNVL